MSNGAAIVLLDTNPNLANSTRANVATILVNINGKQGPNQVGMDLVAFNLYVSQYNVNGQTYNTDLDPNARINSGGAIAGYLIASPSGTSGASAQSFGIGPGIDPFKGTGCYIGWGFWNNYGCSYNRVFAPEKMP